MSGAARLRFVRRRDRVRDLRAQDFAVAQPQPMKCLLQGVFGHAQFRADLGLRRMSRLIRQQHFQSIEQGSFSGAAIFLLQSREHLIEDRGRPVALVNLLGGQVFGWLQIEALLHQNLVERNGLIAAAAFDRLRAVMLVREKMLQRHQQVGTQPAFLAPRGFEIPAREKTREKFLGQILRLLPAITFPPNECVKRQPVTAAKLFERVAGRGGSPCALRTTLQCVVRKSASPSLNVSAPGATKSNLPLCPVDQQVSTLRLIIGAVELPVSGDLLPASSAICAEPGNIR